MIEQAGGDAPMITGFNQRPPNFGELATSTVEWKVVLVFQKWDTILSFCFTWLKALICQSFSQFIKAPGWEKNTQKAGAFLHEASYVLLRMGWCWTPDVVALIGWKLLIGRICLTGSTRHRMGFSFVKMLGAHGRTTHQGSYLIPHVCIYFVLFLHVLESIRQSQLRAG